MNFWTKDRLAQALPYAKFYNIPDEFNSSGVCVAGLNAVDGKICLVRKPDEKIGVAEVAFKSLSKKTKFSAILCTDYEYFKSYDIPIIAVDDADRAIYDLAVYIRNNYQGQVVAITGSAGKSTTTEICYNALKNYEVSCNLNRANTVFGLSWNLTNYDIDVPYWVNEVSLNRGMYPSARLVKPDVAVITNVAPVHLKLNETIETTVELKSRIFSGMKEGGAAVLNKDCEYFNKFYEAAKAKGLRVITFGKDERSDVRVVSDEFSGFSVSNETFVVSKYPMPEHVLLDMAAVAGIFIGLGLPIDSAVVESFKSFRPISGRGAIYRGKIGADTSITLMDESYNANPLSVKMTLEGFEKIFGENQNKLLILGDMSEGGADTVSQHKNLAQTVLKSNYSRVVLVGEYMSVLHYELKDKMKCYYYRNSDDLAEDILSLIKNDDYIFVKGSNSIGLGKIVELLKTKIKENK